MKKGAILRKILICCMVLGLLCGCSIEHRENQKIRDLDFTVVSIESVPQACQEMILQKQETPFSFVYREGEYMYLCVGYGKQESSGYSISVNEVYLTQNAIVMDSTLHGPQGGEIQKPTYPCVIVKLENMEENVIFS